MKIFLSIFVCVSLVVSFTIPVLAYNATETHNVIEARHNRLGESSVCSKCGKTLTGAVGEQNALSVALGLTVCNDCWWQIVYGNDYDTTILNVAQLGEDGKVIPDQLPTMQGGETTWGNITGTISNQTDLQNALNTKLSSELDPLWKLSASYEITSLDLVNWNNKLSSVTGTNLDNVFSTLGLLKRTGTGTYTTDTNTYLTGNQSITLSGVISGTGSTSITTSYSAAPSWKIGQTTYSLVTVSGTQTIAHGLGRIPKYVHIKGLLVFSASVSMECNGYYDGSTQSGSAIIWTEGTTTATTDNLYQSTAAALGFSNAGAVNPFTGATKASGVITFDATNITITWTKTGSPTGTVSLAWEVQ